MKAKNKNNIFLKEILVIEDDEGLRNLIIKKLKKLDFIVSGVGTGKDAIDKVISNSNLTLLLDQNLPDMSGKKLIEDLKKKNIIVPFIMMTGQGDEQLAVEIMKSGAADYLVKDTNLLNLLPKTFEKFFKNLENEKRIKEAEELIKIQNKELAVSNKKLKQLNSKLVKANNEIKTLIEELHHRVKNNLQIIQSIINMQKRYIAKDTATTDLLNECINRINAIAIIHENLYYHEEFSKIDMRNYIDILVKNLIGIYSTHEMSVNVNVDIDKIFFDIDKASNIGMLITEIITNSLKHAFINKPQGNLLISLKKRDKNYELVLKDDGIGLPENINLNDTIKSYGLTLVTLFIKQLDGKVEIYREKGTKYTICF